MVTEKRQTLQCSYITDPLKWYCSLGNGMAGKARSKSLPFLSSTDTVFQDSLTRAGNDLELQVSITKDAVPYTPTCKFH